MENKNALEAAKQMLAENNLGEAYKICLDYLENDDNDWDLLEDYEYDEIILLRIKCIIKTIWLGELFSGEYGGEDGTEMICSEKCKKTVESLEDAMSCITTAVLLCGDDDNLEGYTSKLEYFEREVNKIAQEHFYEALEDVIVANAGDDKDYKNIQSYRIGYCCLVYIIAKNIYSISDVIDAAVCEDDDGLDWNFAWKEIHKESEMRFRDLCYEYGEKKNDLIIGYANDFPYFYDSDISFQDMAVLYTAAIYLITLSLPDIHDKSQRKVRDARLRRLINIYCDSLNAIFIIKGNKQSVIPGSSRRSKFYDNIKEHEKELQQYDSNYKHPPVNIEEISALPQKSNTASSGGCYVATCVYGSYDCPQVWTLRRYRDNTLAKTWYGRAFIKTYYAVSPSLVKWFGDTNWFKNMWKGKLDRMVKRLNNRGIENTEYNDIHW